MFSSLEQGVIWKANYNCESNGNVKTMKWIPQNDLLANENLKLLITHGGISSLLEGVFRPLSKAVT